METTKPNKAVRLTMALTLAVTLCVGLGAADPDEAQAYTQIEKIVNDGHGALNPSYLVIHETANPGASAWNHVRLWSRGYPYAVHYVMDLNGKVVYHTMHDDRKAWHIGNGNPRAVGIELTHATNQADFDRQYAEAVKWAGDYLNKRGWSINQLISHNDATNWWGGSDHTDPIGYFAQYGKSWPGFKADVKSYMATGEVSGNAGSNMSGSSGGAVASGSTASQGTYVVTASALNVRQGPGTGYAKVPYRNLTANAKAHATSSGALKKGTRVTVYETRNGWARIPSGWVSMDYLGTSKASASASHSGTYTVTAKSGLNVRTGPSTGYRITGTLRYGYKIHSAKPVGNGWYKYQAYSGTRYVYGAYLRAS